MLSCAWACGSQRPACVARRGAAKLGGRARESVRGVTSPSLHARGTQQQQAPESKLGGVTSPSLHAQVPGKPCRQSGETGRQRIGGVTRPNVHAQRLQMGGRWQLPIGLATNLDLLGCGCRACCARALEHSTGARACPSGRARHGSTVWIMWCLWRL